MPKLYSRVRLRPTRIGFLVSPSDKISVRKIMRSNACLWGGQYNPIIPVLNTTIPKDWQDKHYSEKGKDITQGYIKFFEPDVYVEAKGGLLEKAGLSSFRDKTFRRSYSSLENFFDIEYRGKFDPAFGQSVFDLIEHTYISEMQFKLRDEKPAVYAEKEGDLLSELFLGVYPNDKNIRYFKNQFDEVFRPDNIRINPENWLKIYSDEFVTPFSISNSHFEVERARHNEPVIYLFDPRKNIDLIDLWNMRIQASNVYPVPVDWLPSLSENLKNFIDRNHRPLKNNANGVMHRTTVEISRLISEEYTQDKIIPFFKGVKSGAYSIKAWRTRVWSIDYNDTHMVQPERAKLSATESTNFLELSEEGGVTAEFSTHSPKFSEKHSGSEFRWANVLTFGARHEESDVAYALPYNTLDRDWPNYGIGEFINCREGWVFLQKFKDINGYISFLTQDEAFIQFYKRLGVRLSLSEAGRIAKQMIETLGGFLGLSLVDDEISIQFVNKLAHSTRIRTNEHTGTTIEEDFVGRSATIEDWAKMIRKRQPKTAHRSVDMNQYVRKNIAKLGIVSDCGFCNVENWHALDEVSYEVSCNRCLKTYPFPQGDLKGKNKNWKYRVIGPFAIPDYAQGAYTSLLTIRFFHNFISRDINFTYSTAMDIYQNDRKITDVDFMIWKSEQVGTDLNGEPRLIIGEAKSFARNGITEKELGRLKEAAALLPGSILVISVLKKEFSDEEKKALAELVAWSRDSDSHQPKHWLILLTGTELFGNHLGSTWKKLGEPYSKYAEYHNLRSFRSLSNSTLAIYLGLSSFNEVESRKLRSQSN